MGKILLLTGTIAPATGMAYTALTDPQVRLQQYLRAIRYYLSATRLKIVFVENSGTDITAWFKKEIDSGRLEIYSYTETPDSIALGKGMGETNIISFAITHSPAIRDADQIIKITGRHVVKNIGKFTDETLLARADVIAMADLEKGFTLSAFFIFRPSFFRERFMAYATNINDHKGYYFEHALTHAIYDLIRAGGQFRYPDSLPRIRGISGTKNQPVKSVYIRWLWTNQVFIAWKSLKTILTRRLTT